jgi:Family of unknown function (DUF5631)/Family of unknown function (DUF5632)
VAIFGRLRARQRLRRAAQQSLTTAKFSTPVDCTPWVIDDVWPLELHTVTPETARLADYLRRDLERIADSANEKLKAISESGVTEADRRAEEERVISAARAFAVQRVESTVRTLRTVAPTRDTSAEEIEEPRTPEPRPAEMSKPAEAPEPGPQAPEPDEFSPAPAEPRAPEPVEPPGAPATKHVEPPKSQPDERRLRRLAIFVALQEAGLRWAVGQRDDGTTAVATDLAHGWIPPGIALPAGVELPPPGRRTGNAAAMLGPTTLTVKYAPGDSLAAAREFDPSASSQQPRVLPAVQDLGWKLQEATHRRDGLPRLVHTLAKAGAAGTGVVEAETDVLRVHADTARYQLLAQYPDVDEALLLNCMLLAATEGLVTGDRVAANYHFAWFETLTTPQPVSSWHSAG